MSGTVGNVAELRKIIFSFAQKRDLAVCARVCSTWTADALDVVWTELPSPLPLLALTGEGSLCPTMTWVRGEGHATISKPVPWARFRSYALRVREISFTHSTSLKYMLERLALLKALCPELPLLPNLEKVTVYPSSQIIWVSVVAMFLHSGVRRLEICPPENDGPSFFTYPDFFREVLQRAPLLEDIRIGECSLLTFSRTFREEDATILAGYVSQFPQLMRLSAPGAVLASLQDIPTALPKLRALLEINALRPQITVRDYRGAWRPDQIGTTIEHLAVSVTFDGAITLLSANRMAHLRILNLEALMSSEPQNQDMTTFFRTISTRCPALEELTIKWTLYFMTSLTSTMQSRELEISEFEPLADCALLSVLDISAPCALTFDESKVALFAAVLPPNLRICRLSFIPPRGPIAERPTFSSLASLVPFAMHCRFLEELSVMLDPKLPDVDTDVGPIIPFGPRFRSLSIGHFVAARGWDASAVALYLARLLPQDFSVTVPSRPIWSRPLWTNQEEIAEGENRLKQAFGLVPTYM
ncbi:hypothetical protein B0H19DRAFT_1378058 [Mycena capillaripes]|nr:hypothetical protein B0H19DRAFT_1378058 [Mycena capillaripes]